MRALIKYNLKIIWSSPIYWASTGFIAAFFELFVFLIYPQSTNFSITLHAVTYIEIILMIFVFCAAIYFSHINYSVEQLVQIPEYLSIFTRLLSTIVLLGIVLFLPLSFAIVASLLEGVELVFLFEILLDVLLRWASIICLFSSLGFLFGAIFRHNIVYLASIPCTIMFSHLNSLIIEKFLPEDSRSFLIITNLLSSQAPFQNAVRLEYTSSFLDGFFFSKIVTVLAISATIVCLILLLTSHKKRSKQLVVFFLFSIAATSISCYIYVKLFPRSYDYEEKIYPSQRTDSPFEIVSYSGDVNLSEKFSAVCTVQIKQNTPSAQNELLLRLDESLIVDSMVVDGREVPFTRDRDYLTVKPTMLPDTPLFNVELEYHGRIYYISDISGVNIISLHKTAALPSSFAFIPIIDSKPQQKSYHMNVTGANSIISNICPVKETSNTYTIDGESDTLCLFMGYFTSFTANESTVYRAKYNKVTNYREVFSDAFNYSHFDPYTGEQSNMPLSSKPTVFLIYDLYGILGYPVQYNDYWIMNYGFPI